MKFRYNIAKVCTSCGRGFITDFFEEETECEVCRGEVVSSKRDFVSIEDVDAEQEIHSLLNPYGCITKPVFYD
jgi:hypothetical protein